jgi:hypothetical protein
MIPITYFILINVILCPMLWIPFLEVLVVNVFIPLINYINRNNNVVIEIVYKYNINNELDNKKVDDEKELNNDEKEDDNDEQEDDNDEQEDDNNEQEDNNYEEEDDNDEQEDNNDEQEDNNDEEKDDDNDTSEDEENDNNKENINNDTSDDEEENKELKNLAKSKKLCNSSDCECMEICEEGKKNVPEKLCDSSDCMCECQNKMIINGKIIFVDQNLD